ncbi:MAG: bifunctional metallophosphatase/5'-nucleotidase [Candidatus Amulumruptor caecigallinarius]|nr:bifunctional metallophosphatase/5'-nucleotidase [Candidatus Amulumruptor caecigallinarius]
MDINKQKHAIHIGKRNILAALITLFATSLFSQQVVLLHTNDTHSNIDPDKNGVGGILPRKAIIDSVRKAEKNVMLIDAGDMVQGTLYFKYFKGDVEYPIFNMMDYDIRILGNHEFDNGLEDLAKYWKQVKATPLSANYDFSNTPAKGIFKPYVIKKVGGKKIGFMGLNVDPTSLITEENYKGMVFKDVISTANATAAQLKKQGCDLVVAVTHIGYDSENNKSDDIDLARASKDIDIIIGGHSHTFVDPKTPDKTPYWIKNADGRDVLVAQTGKYGRNVGYIKLDLSNFSEKNIDYEYIPVTGRFSPDAYDQQIKKFLAPYKHAVDSVNARVIGFSEVDMPNQRKTGEYANWTGDFAASFGRNIADSLRAAGCDVPYVDFGIMNVGGIRQNMNKGEITEGQILSTFPFNNKMRLISMKGKDIIETMKIVARKGGEAISSELKVVSDSTGNAAHVVLNGQEMDPERDYVVSTIDYVAEGNDDMTPMKNHSEIWRDDEEVSVRILQYIINLNKLGVAVNSDPNPRFVKVRKH